jgi:hypothetical protein
MNSNERYPSLDRTLGANKAAVDPATRLSELLAQSLEELTRPFDPANPAPPREGAQSQGPAEPPAPEQTPEESRIDADKALAELEAELFAAAKQVDRETSAPVAEVSTEQGEEQPVSIIQEGEATPAAQETVAAETGGADQPDAIVAAYSEKSADAPSEADIGPLPLVPDAPAAPQDEAAAAAVIARVRKLMLVSMAVTVLAVGSVFGFIGYRIFKGEGTTAKTADKLPPASAIPTDITLSLPRGARVIQAAVAAERLVITLETDGKTEVRTFDVKTLQPAGRINFSGTP